MEVELVGSVSSRGEQDVAIFPPEFVGEWNGLYSGPFAEDFSV